MRQESKCEAKRPVVVKRGHESVMVPAHFEDGDGALTPDVDLVSVRKPPAEGDEVRKITRFNQPLPHGEGLRRVGILPGPFPKG